MKNPSLVVLISQIIETKLLPHVWLEPKLREIVNFRITLDQKIEPTSAEHAPTPSEALLTVATVAHPPVTPNQTDKAIQEALKSMVSI